MTDDGKGYLEKLRDPRWQKRRLQICERDDWACQNCFDTKATLHVHHRYYENGEDPWEADDRALVTLCESCHQLEKKPARREAEDLLIRALREHLFATELRELARLTARVFEKWGNTKDARPILIELLCMTLEDPTCHPSHSYGEALKGYADEASRRDVDPPRGP